MRELQIFCDFDGTITKEDTLNKFLRLYADKKWLDIEEDWVKGEIGSRECTERQMKLVPMLSESELNDFINSIEIDEHFLEFYKFIKKIKNTEFYIVSDGFDYFIKSILEKNGLGEIKVFANNLTIQNGEYICKFPYISENCKIGAGVCKCNIVKKYENKEKQVFYIGDGFSDFCVSKKVPVVFAKGKLLEYCKKSESVGSTIIGFENFKEILNYIDKK